MDVLKNLKDNIIISVQAQKGEPLYEQNCIIALAKSVIDLAGIRALRLAGCRDIKNIKSVFPDVIIIGITKPDVIPQNYKELVYITPTVEDCAKIIEAGADIVAFDATLRKREKDSLEDIVNFVKSQDKLAMADISTFEEAKNAVDLGCDIVSTTLSGYTTDTLNKPDCPDFELVKKIKQNLDIFTILEGKIWEKNDVLRAFEAGADSVVIGSAVTRPQLIAKRFIEALKNGK